MPRATCRCGQELPIPAGPNERVVCPGCGSRVRVRVSSAAADEATQIANDGFIRFFCPCGRRLKVDAIDPPAYGKCPDCGEVVPVPRSGLAINLPSGHPESPTEELSAVDRAMLEQWAADHRARGTPVEAVTAPKKPVAAVTSDRDEVGMRICPKCRQPVHMGAEACRACGTPMPRR